MELETITNRDEFGNYETDLYSCPLCGNDRVVYVFQFHGWMCEREECEWVDGMIFAQDFGLPFPEPKRRAMPWQEIWPEMAAAALPADGEETDDQQRVREIMNPVNIGWSRGLPLGEH